MKLNIELMDTKTYDEMYVKVAEPIHKSLAGNKTYIESDIVLNLDNESNEPSCNLIVNTNNCPDKELLRQQIQNAVDIFIDTLK